MTDTQTDVQTAADEKLIQDLPVVAERNFNKLLLSLEISKEKLNKDKAECLAISVTDKASYKVADELRKREKNKRVLLKNRAKEIRDGYNKAAGKVIELEKEYSSIISDGEEYLGKIQDEWETAEEERKKKEAEKFMVRYNKRFQELSHLGVLATDDMKFRLDDLVVDVDLVKNVDDDIYEESILSPFKAVFEKQEAERLEKERIDRQRQEKWEQQQKEMEQQRAEFEKERKLFEEERQKRKDAEFQARLSQLVGIGLTYDGRYESFVLEDINVHKVDIITYDEQQWTKLINEITPLISERKAAAEAEKERQKLEHERKQNRTVEIVRMGFFVNEVVIAGYRKQYSIEELNQTDEIFSAFLELLRQDKMEFENAEKEKIRQQIIEEERRRIEAENQRKQLELAEAADKDKWADVKEKLQSIIDELPQFKSRRFNKAAAILKEKVQEIIDLKPGNFN